MATSNEKLADEAIRHRVYLSRYGTEVANKILRVLRQYDDTISAELAVALAASKANPLNMSMRRLAAIKKAISGTIYTAFDTAFDAMQGELKPFSQYESEYQIAALNKVLPAQIRRLAAIQSTAWQTVYAAAEANPFQGRTLKQWADKLPEDTITRIGNAVQTGILTGESHSQIIQRVTGSPQAGQNDGSMALSRSNLGNLTKTAVNHVAAEVREATAQANSDIIQSRKWLSTLDTHTSKICIVRDGLEYTADPEPQPIGHNVPYGAGPGKIHFCCRSTETWVLSSWEKFGIKPADVTSATRASMNGEVPANTNYRQWLERQSYATIEKVVGVTRARAIRNGEIRADELFSDRGEYLTLQQLKDADLLD